MLTGKVPTKGADPPTSPLDFVITCPEEIALAIEGALRLDPKARPSAAQLAQNLIDALEGEEEAFARAVAMATPAGRPPLRLVPAGPQAQAEWTEHPIPDVSSEPAMSAALGDSPPTIRTRLDLRRTRRTSSAAQTCGDPPPALPSTCPRRPRTRMTR